MKRILQTAALALVISLGGSLLNAVSAQPGYDDYEEGYDEGYGQQQADVSYQTFYDELSPHGRWIDYPEHGYVWVPNNVPGFRPYETAGHWVWTEDYESMWVSDYSWGWAPFHYGRWFHDPYYGWMWVPGYEWSPAWVAWRDGGEYYGWAPLRPGINISINVGIGRYNPPMDYWVFAPRRYINSPRIYDYCIDRGRNVTIINNTTIINNYSRRNNVFINGPRRLDVQRYAGRINPVRFRESSRPGRTQFRNNEVSVYRPRIQRENNRQFTPRAFDRYERTAQSDNRGFDRNRDNASNRGNNPQVRQQDNSSNNGASENRRFGRRNADDQQAGNANSQRTPGNIIQRGNDLPAPTDRPARRFEQRSNNEAREQGSNDNNRRFERRSADAQPQAQQRTQEQQPQRRFENRQREQQQEQQRQVETRQREQQQQQQRQLETRQRDQQQAQQQARQREQSQGQQRQFENRQREQQQPRAESRGNSGNREQRASSDNNGPRRFGRRD